GNLSDHGLPGTPAGIALTPDEGGYYIVTTQGNLFGFGDASGYYGNLTDHGFPGTPAGIALTFTGHGYYIPTMQGNLYGFGDATSGTATARITVSSNGNPGHTTASFRIYHPDLSETCP